MKSLVKWDKRKLLAGLKEDRKKNRIGNLRFIDIHIAWLKRKSNKEWSKRQKELIDSIYKANRKLKINPH